MLEFLTIPLKYHQKVFTFCAIRNVAQSGRVLQWGCSGRWFESNHSDELKVYFRVDLFCFQLAP